MHKSSLFKIISFSIIGLATFSSCSKKSNNSNRAKEVIIYTYDSFTSEWGCGNTIKQSFEEKTGYTVTYVDCGDGVQVLSRAILEKKKPNADIILGLDNNISQRAIEQNILLPYKPKDADKIINPELKEQLCSDWSLTPFDYSHFSFVFDTKSSVPCPSSLQDLTNPVYSKKIILMDPRTSTPGLGFVAWTVAVYGQDVLDYWKALKPNILTMAPGWSTGYGLFKKGEAPLVISYTTSPASHVEYDNTDRYIAPVFEQGHTLQIEGAGILKNAPNIDGAKAFLDFLISKQAQDMLPLTQWMNPINPEAELPDSFKVAAPIPSKTISADAKVVEDYIPQIMAILEQ